MSKLEVDTIAPQSGTTITVGEAGDTVDISNATLSANLNATNLTSGTIPDARFPATLPAVDGSQLTGVQIAGGYTICDSITVTNTDTFALTSGGSPVSPESAANCLVSLNGILQAPISSYTISGSNIIFASALVAGSDVIDFITVLGTALNVGTVSDGAITSTKIQDSAVTPVKLGYDYNQYRNIIINGDMSIAQRGTSQASITSGNYYTLDRFKFIPVNIGTWTMSQDTDVPSGQGFAKSLKIDCTTADASPASTDRLQLQQIFEGQNLQYLKKGTANAESLTASFWVKSNKTGTYIVEIRDMDNSRTISKSYTIDASNTWEKKTITFAGDTSGALDNDNAGSIRFNFWLGSGSTYTSGTLQTSWGTYSDPDRAVGQVNLADNTANEWYVTGVQLEAGTTASEFEFLPYDVNLQRCFRYFEKFGGGNIHGGSYNGATTIGHVQYKLRKRATPTLSNVTGNNVSSTVAGIDNFHFTGTQPSYVVSASMDSEL